MPSIAFSLADRLYRNPRYVRLVTPLAALACRFKRIPTWLQWIIAPAVPSLKPATVRAHKARVRWHSPPVFDLQRRGYVDLTHYFSFSPADIRVAVDHFADEMAFVGQVPRGQSALSGADHNYVSYHPSSSLSCPAIQRVLRSAAVQCIAADYLGYWPKVYSVNTMRCQHASRFHEVTDVHRDYDDFNFLTCFIYWTDTRHDNGATWFDGRYLEGKAGSVFLIDSYREHAGNKRISSPRLATWIRYGRIPNFAYVMNRDYLLRGMDGF